MTTARPTRDPRPRFHWGNFILITLVTGGFLGLFLAIWLHDWFHQNYLASAGAVFVVTTLFVLWWCIRDHQTNVDTWRGKMKFRVPKRNKGGKHKLMAFGLIVAAIPLYFLLAWLFGLI